MRIKTFLWALSIVGICSIAHSQIPTPLPPDSAELVAKYKRWKEAKQKNLESKANTKRRALITALLAQKKDATRKGNLRGALAIESEVNILKERDQREQLIKQMKGKWEWNTGAEAEFDREGRTESGHLVLWAINPGERLLYYRGGDDWHYDIVLSEDGESFTATRIQSGKQYSAKRIPK